LFDHYCTIHEDGVKPLT